MNAPTEDWLRTNQRSLADAIEALRERIAAAGRGEAAGEHACEPPPALQRLAGLLGLSPFERDVVLLAAGRELSSAFVHTLAAVNGGRPWPSFSLALALLPGAHWSALAPEAPLRAWRLVELSGDGALAERELRLDEPVLHWLTGMDAPDPRLDALLMEPPQDGLLAPSQQAQVQAALERFADGSSWVLEISGSDAPTRCACAAAFAAARGLTLRLLPAAHIPATAEERAELAVRLRRAARLNGLACAIEGGSAEADLLIAKAADREAPLLVLRAGPSETSVPGTLPLRLEEPSAAELRELWRTALQGLPVEDEALDRVAHDFRVGPRAIASVARELRNTPQSVPVGERLWDLARQAARRDLGTLARAIEPVAQWDDLVLPARGLALLQDIVAQLRHRWRVHELWGFRTKGQRGLGLATLFAGQSGVGKTMAAEVIANALGMDLYQIDLSSVVSKYIGETEKNLRQLFDAAEGSGAILFFDEADALFGRRSEVKDSHDRYANIEVSYLLQRMETYRGLAILASNLKASLDQAFLRRLRFVVDFPFPDAADRARIWQKAFPEATPRDGLDYARLARLHVPGGNIRNIALNAAFIAAEQGEPVRMAHILRAAQAEYAKLERPLSDAEVAGWT